MEDFLKELDFNTEDLNTVEGDEFECITIENLKGIIKRYTIIKNEED